MLRSYDVTITGVTPLLINRFHEQAQEEATTHVHTRREASTPLEDATMRLYQNSHGPYFPGENIRQAIINAAGRTKIGRRSATTDVAASLFVLPYEVLITPKEWVVDARPVVNPTTRGRSLRYRPRFDQWAMAFQLQVDTDLVDINTVRKILDDAGNYVGLGDYRPQRKGPHGRFRVDSWKEATA